MAVAARLLIIDDEPDSSEFMKLLVEPRGYLVRDRTGELARSVGMICTTMPG